MTPTSKITLWIIGALVVIIGAYAYMTRDNGETVDDMLNNDNTTVACTMDAKLCPDGSYVGRVAPNCEFALCPGATSTSTAGTGMNTGIDANGNLMYPADILK